MDPPPPTTVEARPGPWDGYLVGPENAAAQAGAMALARGEPGASPLVVVGPAGSGKSRLMAALVADWLGRRPGSAIAHLSAEAFVTACREAAEAPDGWPDLRGRFRGVDLLALDDLHGLARSPIALAEFDATLDALERSGAAVAVAARDGLDGLDGWPGRLVDRLRGGLLVRLAPPGPSSRRRYLRDRSRTLGLRASAEALDALAEGADGYRTLDGWLARLALAARVDRRPIDVALAARLLDDDPAGAPAVTVDVVARAVAERFGVRPSDLRSPSRRAALVVPRHLALYLARELTGASFAALGDAFGRRDPKTVRHACLAAASRLSRDPSLAAAAEAIRRRCLRTTPADDP